MEIATVRSFLEQPELARSWLGRLKVRDVDRGLTNFLGIARQGIPLDLLAHLAHQLEEKLPTLADPDMALNNLERFFSAARNPLSLAALFERDPEALPPLLQIFSTSQFLSDILVTDPEAYDLLRLTEGEPVARQVLVDELTAEVRALTHEVE
ncbi:MAG: hypothetical protein H5U08_19485, partial [Thermogutta sp.]|nr:hypothetical protein [Thermogutta sp.]